MGEAAIEALFTGWSLPRFFEISIAGLPKSMETKTQNKLTPNFAQAYSM